MIIRSLAFILIVGSSFGIVVGQVNDLQSADRAAKTSGTLGTKKLRDIPFPNGIDIQFLIKELARELDLNVLFDVESRIETRKMKIELRNVTAGQALDYILLQEHLVFEEAGPKTILVSNRYSGISISRIGVGFTSLTEQLAQYFGVDGGVLIHTVRDQSPASEAGVKAGDVIVEIDGISVNGTLALFNTIKKRSDGPLILTVIRDRERKTITVTPKKIVDVVEKPE